MNSFRIYPCSTSVLFIVLTLFSTNLCAELVPESLASAWLFDEGEGLTTGNAVLDGEGGILTSPTWVPGRYGHALQFNGVDQFVRIRHDSRLDPRDGDFSITLWLRPEGSHESRVIWKDDGNPGALHHGYFVCQTGKPPRFAFSFGDGERHSEAVQRGNIETGEWYHLAIVRDVSQGKVQIYVDGELLNETTRSAGDVYFEKDLCVGGRPGTAEMFQGALDEVALFRAALTEYDIHQIMNHGLRRALNLSKRAATGTSRKKTRSDDGSRFPLVLVAPDGSGDFGPETPGTRTAGIQEAINHCAEKQRDLFIRGGPGVTYRVSETIEVLAVNDFSIDGGNYTIEWNGPGDKDLLHVNSGLDAHYTFSTLVYGGSAAAVRLWPNILSNLDRAEVFLDSELHIRTVRSRGARRGTGVVFQPHGQGIGHADFHFGEIDGFATGLDIQDSMASVRGVNLSRIVCERVHTWVRDGTLIRVGRTVSQNTIIVGMEVDENATGVLGLDLAGNGNIVEATLNSSFDRGNAVFLRSTASNNQVRLDGPWHQDPTRLVTDRALSATNRVSSTTMAIRSRKISLPAGTVSHTQRLFPARVRVRGEQVSQVELVRGPDSVNFDQTEEILMSVGDQLRVVSTLAPTLRIQPWASGDSDAIGRTPAGLLTRPQRMTEEQLADAVIVSWDGTGDFGTETYGTNTAGLQEAINYAIAHGRNVYVKGGWGGKTRGYSVHGTVRIPAAENFHIEGGEYTLGYSGPRDQDLFIIDSGVNCYYQFGLIGNNGTQAAIRIQPRSKLPDGSDPVFKNSVVRTTSIGQAGPPEPRHYRGIGGVVFDTSYGPIVHNEFFHSAPMSSPRVFVCGTGEKDFAHNILRASHTHSEAFIGDIVLLTIGPRCHDNIFDTAVSINNGIPDGGHGLVVEGENNLLDILTPGGIAAGKTVVFAPESKGNTLNLRHPDGVDPMTLLTDSSESPTNRVKLGPTALPIHTVELQATTTSYTQRLLPATVRVLGGGKDNTPFHVNDQPTPLSTSGNVFLDVGDRLSWDGSSKPVKLLIIPVEAEFEPQRRRLLWSP